jgi:hypothetical protein
MQASLGVAVRETPSEAFQKLDQVELELLESVEKSYDPIVFLRQVTHNAGSPASWGKSKAKHPGIFNSGMASVPVGLRINNIQTHHHSKEKLLL